MTNPPENLQDTTARLPLTAQFLLLTAACALLAAGR